MTGVGRTGRGERGRGGGGGGRARNLPISGASHSQPGGLAANSFNFCRPNLPYQPGFALTGNFWYFTGG